MNRADRELFNAILPRHSRRVALAGDSLFGGQYTTIQNTSANPRVHWGIEAYSRHGLKVVAPINRDCFMHAVGGCDSGEMTAGQLFDGLTIYQMTELVDHRGNYDAVVIQLGANDIIAAGYDIDTAMTNMAGIVDTLAGRGKRVFLQTMIPSDEYAAPQGARNDLTVAWNARLKTDFSGTPGVTILDMDSYFESDTTPGTDSGVWGVSGAHQTEPGSLKNAAVIAQALHSSWGGYGPWDNMTPVTAVPYLDSAISGGTIIHAGGNISSAYVARGDGEVGERWLDITQDHNAMTIGSGDGAVTYTCQSGKKCHVWVYASSGDSNATLSAERHEDLGDGTSLIVINPVRTGLSITTTANEMVSFIAANHSDLIVATAGGTGLGTVSFGSAGSATIYTHYANNLFTPDEGDRLRAICILRKHPDHDWPIGLASMSLDRWTPGLSTGRALVSQAYVRQHNWPEPISDDEIIVASPWYEVQPGESQWRARLLVNAFGTYRVGRVMVQKELAR